MHHWLPGIILPEIKGCTLSLKSLVCWLAILAAQPIGRANVANVSAWSLLVVSEVSCGPDNKEAEALRMSWMIPGMGLK
jgi:hypothetical protein